MASSDSGPGWFGAIALLVVGLVIFVPSGLCTGAGIIFGAGPLAVIIGGPFVVGGGILTWKAITRIGAIKRKPEG